MIKFNKKVFLGIATLLLIFAIVAVSSFIPFILDPSKFSDKAYLTKFITDECIIVAITIATTISTMFIAQASNSANPKSELAKSRSKFLESVEKITSITKFYQWIVRVLRVKDINEIIDREMLKIGVKRAVYELENSEIELLTQDAQKINDIFFKKIDKNTAKRVLTLKKKVAHFKFVSPNYYTTIKSYDKNKTNSEIAVNENKKKTLTIVVQLTTRILLTLIVAFIFAMLVFDKNSDLGMAQKWLDFLSRMFAFVSSAFMGYLLGSKLNDMEAYYINNKVDTQRMFMEDTEFKEIDEDKQAFIDRCRREERKLLTTMPVNDTKTPLEDTKE